MTVLTDTFGRTVTDLRVSLTDRCNFRCTYCMPAEGLPWLPREEVLTVGEIERLVRIFVAHGVREIKLTGGEPTVRGELLEIVARLRSIDDELDLSLTTNGFRLERLAQPLRDAGLDRVNISCDSLLRHRFFAIARRDALDQVRAGMVAAQEAGFSPIKLNCVVMAGTNDDEVVDFARLARETGYDVRFIEYMPLDADHAWERAKVVPSRVIREAVHATFPLVVPQTKGPEPASTYTFADGAPGSVGFISSVTEPFCDTCNRVRITAEGRLRTCLFSLDETDLREPMRRGAPDADVEELIAAAVRAKWAGHRINHPDFVQPLRTMSAIGG